MSTLPVFVDYKDIKYLEQFLNPHARMTSARKGKIPASHQRKIAAAVKRARYMGLLPYVAR